MRDNRIWNLAVKMSTHGLSGRNGILALLGLRTPNKSKTRNWQCDDSDSLFGSRQSVWEGVKLTTWAKNNEEYASTRPQATEETVSGCNLLCVCVRGGVHDTVREAERGQNESCKKRTFSTVSYHSVLNRKDSNTLINTHTHTHTKGVTQFPKRFKLKPLKKHVL